MPKQTPSEEIRKIQKEAMDAVSMTIQVCESWRTLYQEAVEALRSLEWSDRVRDPERWGRDRYIEHCPECGEIKDDPEKKRPHLENCKLGNVLAKSDANRV